LESKAQYSKIFPQMPEEDAFALLIALMDSYCLRNLYMPGVCGRGRAILYTGCKR
jgi:hypothetical protein